MPYLAPPKEDPNYKGEYNYVWVQKATATKPAAFIYEDWSGYGTLLKAPWMTAAQKKKWKDFKFPRNNNKQTVAKYKKSGFVEVEIKDIVKLFKDYVPRSYAAALKSKKIDPKSKYRFIKDGTDWAESYAPIDLIYDKTSVNSVYNKFLKSMTWGGKKPRKDYMDSPANYFWGWVGPLNFKGGWHSVVPNVYGSDTTVLHNYQTGKVAVVTECGGDDDEAGYYAMGPVAFEWKLNPKLLAAMNKPAAKKPKAKAKPKAPVRKPAVKPRKTTTNKVMTKAEAKKKFIAVAQPYWIKHLTSIKQMFQKEEKKYPEEYEDYGELPSKQADKYLKMAKSGRLRALETLREYSDLIPAGFYHLINYDRNDYDTWKTSAEYFEGPKATVKQLKALLPAIKGNAIATKPAAKKAKPKAKKAPAKKPVAKPKARPSPSQSAAATKVGVRKRGNDGFMWEVKKSKNGVHRWVRDSKSTKRAEDYWYWKQ